MFYEILSNRRKVLGISVEQLAEMSGIPKSTVAKVLNGFLPNPAIGTVKALANTLGMKLDALFPNVNNIGDTLSDNEIALLRTYRMLDSHSRALVHLIVEHEAKRPTDPQRGPVDENKFRLSIDEKANPVDMSATLENMPSAQVAQKEKETEPST